MSWQVEVFRAGTGEKVYQRGGMTKLELKKQLSAVLDGNLDAADRPKSLSVAFWWESVDLEMKHGTMCAETQQHGAGSAKPE